MRWLQSGAVSSWCRFGADEVRHIQSFDDLNRLDPSLKRLLAIDIDTLSVIDRICPVLFDDGRAGVFVEDGVGEDDEISAVLDALKRSKYKLHRNPVCSIARPVLLSLTNALRLNDERALSLTAADADEKPMLIRIFDEIIQWATSVGASDIHFNIAEHHCTSAVRFTIDGQYVQCDKFAEYPTQFLSEMLSLAWMDIKGGNGAVFDPTIEQQGRLERMTQAGRLTLRWASLAADRGASVCLRLLRSDAYLTAPDLQELGYLPSQIDAFDRASLIEGGALILSGAVGSGKSTTIATLMRQIPNHRKVITIEDPAEFIIPNALQNTLTRSLTGGDQHVFDAKLATIKRSAMNDLLIGEIRDTAGGRAFMDLAASGSNLYTTVHARSSLLICERLSSSLIGVARDFLCSPGVLKLLVHQMLLPALCSQCAHSFEDVPIDQPWTCVRGYKRPYTWFVQWVELIVGTYQMDKNRLRFRNSHGCEHCQRKHIGNLMGVDGRTVVAEMIEPARESGFLDVLNESNRIQLRCWFEGRPRTSMSDDDMSGKSIFECAIFKMSIGLVDPRAVEERFGAFTVSR